MRKEFISQVAGETVAYFSYCSSSTSFPSNPHLDVGRTDVENVGNLV